MIFLKIPVCSPNLSFKTVVSDARLLFEKFNKVLNSRNSHCNNSLPSGPSGFWNFRKNFCRSIFTLPISYFFQDRLAALFYVARTDINSSASREEWFLTLYIQKIIFVLLFSGGDDCFPIHKVYYDFFCSFSSLNVNSCGEFVLFLFNFYERNFVVFLQMLFLLCIRHDEEQPKFM